MNTCYNPFTLQGKTILVTGASSGIGRAIAIECSRMGAQVFAGGRNKERLNETLSMLSGEGHALAVGDIADPVALENLVHNLPKLNGLVLCAGIGNNTLLSFATREKLNKVFEVNFFSQTELFRLLIKKKKLCTCSSVVAMCSIGGLKKFTFGNGIYGCAKSALRTWTKFASREFSPKKIRINSICPGMIDTPMIHGGNITEEQLKADAVKYPLGRYGKPEDVAYGVVYLLSDASDWVTGTNIIIDGGISD